MATATTAVTGIGEDRFYVVLGGICALIAFGGFSATYWFQVPAGTFVGSPLLHLHGLLFSAWTLFFLSQAAFIAGGRYQKHRAWGLGGIALATAMIFTGAAVAIGGYQQRIANGFGEAGGPFLIVPLSALVLFAGFVTAAILNRRRSDWHKRFMLIGTAALLNAAIARFFFLASAGFGPGLRPGLGPPRPVESALLPAFLADAVIILAVLFDWGHRGRVHPAYLWGLPIMLAVQVLRGPFSRTDAWAATADFLARFAG